MHYVRIFVFKAPKLNVIAIKYPLRKYDNIMYKLQRVLHHLEDQNYYHNGLMHIIYTYVSLYLIQPMTPIAKTLI